MKLTKKQNHHQNLCKRAYTYKTQFRMYLHAKVTIYFVMRSHRRDKYLDGTVFLFSLTEMIYSQIVHFVASAHYSQKMKNVLKL